MTAFRVLQVVAKYNAKSGEKGKDVGIKLDIRVYDLTSFRENMQKLSGADKVELTYEVVDKQDYEETEEVMV